MKRKRAAKRPKNDEPESYPPVVNVLTKFWENLTVWHLASEFHAKFQPSDMAYCCGVTTMPMEKRCTVVDLFVLGGIGAVCQPCRRAVDVKAREAREQVRKAVDSD